MKTISYELSKRLNDLGLLDNIKTEYFYNEGKYSCKLGVGNIPQTFLYKTLTLEEAIEFLPNKINDKYLVFGKNTHGYWGNYLEEDENQLYVIDECLLEHINGKETFLEVIEKMIEYLLDNNLLGK